MYYYYYYYYRWQEMCLLSTQEGVGVVAAMKAELSSSLAPAR
jgi:hypothetical protein